MFGWGVHVSADVSKFVLIVPLHYMMMLVSIPGLLCVLVFGMKAGHPLRNYSLLTLLIVGYGFFGYSTSLTLDRDAGKATLREFEFYHWSTYTFALADVERVYVASGNTSDQLRLQLSDGSVRTLSFKDQYGGKDKAAFKANEFLGKGSNREQ